MCLRLFSLEHLHTENTGLLSMEIKYLNKFLSRNLSFSDITTGISPTSTSIWTFVNAGLTCESEILGALLRTYLTNFHEYFGLLIVLKHGVYN